MRSKRHIFAVFLALALIGPVAGMYVWLQFKKQNIRRTVKHSIEEGLNRDELILLKFTESETQNLEWEHEKEFEFGGEMFDIVERKQVGDTLYFWCWEDNEETELNRQLARLSARALSQNPDHQDRQEKLQTFFKTLFCEKIETFQFPKNNPNKQIPYHLKLTPENCPPVPAPPPQLG